MRSLALCILPNKSFSVLGDTNVRLVTHLTPTNVGKACIYTNCNLTASAVSVELKKKKKLHLSMVVGSHVNSIGKELGTIWEIFFIFLLTLAQQSEWIPLGCSRVLILLSGANSVVISLSSSCYLSGFT
jgi:hypothetical protein